MCQQGCEGEGEKPSPAEDRVIVLAKKWREADKAFAASKDGRDGINEYRARQELRDAIDKLP
jgi:hypothetical protein